MQHPMAQGNCIVVADFSRAVVAVADSLAEKQVAVVWLLGAVVGPAVAVRKGSQLRVDSGEYRQGGRAADTGAAVQSC